MIDKKKLLEELSSFFINKAPELDRAATELKKHDVVSQALYFNMRDIFNHLSKVYSFISSGDHEQANRDFICAQEHLRRGITEAYEVIALAKKEKALKELETFFDLCSLGNEFRSCATDLPDIYDIKERAISIEEKHDRALSQKAHTYEEPHFSETVNLFLQAIDEYSKIIDEIKDINLKYNYLFHEGKLSILEKRNRKNTIVTIIVSFFSIIIGGIVTLFTPQIKNSLVSFLNISSPTIETKTLLLFLFLFIFLFFFILLLFIRGVRKFKQMNKNLVWITEKLQS